MLSTGSPNAVPIRLALALTVFNFSGANAMRVLVTLYVLELGAAPWVVGVVGGLLYLFPLLLSWPIGAMADRRSAFGMLAFAGVCAVASLLLIYLFPVLPMFFAAAALNGLALAFYHVTLQNLIGTLSSADDRATNFSNFSLAGALTSFVGPLIAGVSIDLFGYDWACLIIAGVAGVVLVLLGVWGGTLPRAQPKAQREAAPRLVFDRALVLMLIVSGLVQLGSDLFQFFIPVYGHQIGLSASAIGTVLALHSSAAFIVRFFLPRMMKRVSASRLLVWVFATGAAGFMLSTLASTAFTLGIAAFLFGLGMGIGIPLTVILMYEASAKGRSGQALGVRLTANNLVRMGGPMVFGALGAVVGISGVFWILGAVMAIGCLLARAQRPRAP
jgi:MFS family permease